MDIASLQPLRLYGSNASYFTGKLENYFRLRDISYELVSMRFPADERRMKEKVGVMQMPAVELADGRWMTDTTKIIEWFETQLPEPGLMPVDPLQSFLCLLLEDYADEWLWRPAMHYRWHYPEGAYHQSRHLVDELLHLPVPGFLARAFFRYRQRQGYTRGDGIGADAVRGVEQIYLRTVAQLQTVFEQRPFILGNRPSVADVAFSGPFFRHFAFDPIPLEILRQQGPAVLEWVARLWNTRLEHCEGTWVDGIPADLLPLLNEIGHCYLPYLCANVDAVVAGRKRFDVEVGGVHYRKARYSRYRVWCLQQLRAAYEALPPEPQSAAQALLQDHNCWEPLWRHESLPLLPGQDEQLPFHASSKMVSVNE